MGTTDYLSALNWGASTGGSAGSAETTSTLGADPLDVQIPPSQTRTSHLQIARMKNLLLAMSQDFKGGTRLLCRKQSSNPFGAGETGFYIATDGTAYKVVDGTPTSLTGGGGSPTIGSAVSGGTATRTLYVDGSGNLAQSSGLTHSSATAYSLGGTPTLSANMAATGFVQQYTGTSTNVNAPTWTNATYANSYVDFGAPFATSGYYKDALGIVHIRIAAKSGTASSTVFTLPAGFRPLNQLNIVAEIDNTFGILIITSAGAVSAGSGGTTNVIHSAISFPAEQ